MLCIWSKTGNAFSILKMGPSNVSDDIMSGFLDAVAQLSQIIGKMKLVNLQDHRLIYIPINESNFMAALIDGDESGAFINQFMDRSEELFYQYEDILKLKDVQNSYFYKLLEPEFTKLLLNFPCAYLKEEFIMSPQEDPKT